MNQPIDKRFDPHTITLANAFMAGHKAQQQAAAAQAVGSLDPSSLNLGNMVQVAGSPDGKALIKSLMQSSRPRRR